MQGLIDDVRLAFFCEYNLETLTFCLAAIEP